MRHADGYRQAGEETSGRSASEGSPLDVRPGEIRPASYTAGPPKEKAKVGKAIAGGMKKVFMVIGIVFVVLLALGALILATSGGGSSEVPVYAGAVDTGVDVVSAMATAGKPLPQGWSAIAYTVGKSTRVVADWYRANMLSWTKSYDDVISAQGLIVLGFKSGDHGAFIVTVGQTTDNCVIMIYKGPASDMQAIYKMMMTP